jgi:hypothetical protein
VGETFIKPKKEYEFYFNGGLYLDWEIDKKYPITYTVDEMDPKRIKLKWNSSYSGQFDIVYGSYVKTIVVESLF